MSYINWSAGVKGGENRPPAQTVAAVRDRNATEQPARIRFAQHLAGAIVAPCRRDRSLGEGRIVS